MRKKNLELVFAVVLERMHSVFGIQDLAEMRWTLERMSCLHQPQPSTFKICVMSDMLFRSMCDVRHAVQIHVMHLSSCRAAVVSWVLLGSLLRLIQDALFTFNKCFNHFCINGSGCGYGQMEFFLLSHNSNKFFFFKKKQFIYFTMCLSIVPACMHEHHMHDWYSRNSEEGIGSSGTEATNGCEKSCVLGIEPGSSTRATNVLSHWANSLDTKRSNN